MIYTITAVIIAIYSFLKPKRGFCLYLGFLLFWGKSIPFIIIANRAINIETIMPIYFLLLYLQRRKGMEKPKVEYPLKIPAILFLVAWFASCFFVLYGFGREFIRFMTNSSILILTPWLTWRYLESKEDFRFLFKVLTIVVLFICLYGIAEYVIRENYLYNYVDEVLGDRNRVRNYNSNMTSSYMMARGYKMYSVFEHPIGFGMTIGMYFICVINMYVDQKRRFQRMSLALFTAIMTLPCIVLTKMRSTILFVLISSMGFINFRTKKFYKIAILFTVMLIFSIPFFINNSNIANIFLSLFSSKAQNIVMGTTIDDRMTKLAVVLKIFNTSPIGGIGSAYNEYIKGPLILAAAGMESVWLVALVEHGAIGFIAYVVYLVYTLIIIPKYFRSKEIFLLALSYWVVYTLTTIPGFRTVLFFTLIFYYIKSSEIYQAEAQGIVLNKRKVKFVFRKKHLVM